MTAFGAECFSVAMGCGNSSVSFQSGEEKLYRFNLSCLYDLSLSGTYTVGAARLVSEDFPVDRHPAQIIATPIKIMLNDPVVAYQRGIINIR